MKRVDWTGDWVLYALGGVIIFLLALTVFGEIHEAREWEAFKVAHHCTVVGREKGSMTTGIVPIMGGNGGVGVAFNQEPDKTSWACDDGVTYTQ